MTTERAAFEEWAKNRRISLCMRADGKGYAFPAARAAWDAWSAARAQPASVTMLPASIMRQFRRAVEDAKNRKGMRAGLPKVEIDANNFEGLLDRYEAACAAQPASVDGYYLASFKHTQSGDYVLWWGPDNCGYTPDLEQAGIYTADQIKAGYHDSEHTVPVPVALIEHLRVRRMVDPGDTLNAPMHSAKALREWSAAAPQPPAEDAA